MTGEGPAAAFRKPLRVDGGLVIANNLLANGVQLHLDENEAQLQTAVTDLSTGLRINTAADDPSGLAIATNLQTQADGFTQAAGNVQNASNAAQVALGALTSEIDILDRIRNLAIEAASDIDSQSDRENLQTEVTQLLLEINRIAQNTNFNGLALLDGSHAGYVAQQSAQIQVVANALVTAPPTVSISDPTFVSQSVPDNDYTFYTSFGGWTLSPGGVVYRGNPGPGLIAPLPAGEQAAALSGSGQTLTQAVDVPASGTYTLSFQSGYGNGPLDGDTLGVTLDGVVVDTITPTTSLASYSVSVNATAGRHTIGFVYQGPSSTPNIAIRNVAMTAENPLPSGSLLVASAVAANTNFTTTAGPTPTLDGTIELQVVNTGVSIAAIATFIESATGVVSVAPVLIGPGSTFSGFDNVEITTGYFGAANVGESAYIKVLQNVAAQYDPDAPALTVQSGANEGDTVAIGLPATNTQTLRVSNVNLLVTSTTDPSLGAEDAIGQIDNALELLLSQSAGLGAATVRLGIDAGNDATAAVNLQSAQSTIRDVNVGAETTIFTREQILAEVGTSVLAQANANAQVALALFR